MIKYYATAALLGLGWFIVLLVPSATRDWLLKGGGAIYQLLFLAISAVLVAHLFKGFILRAWDTGERLIRAVVLPYVGCFLYLLLVVAWSWVRQLIFGGLTNVHDSLSTILFGMLSAVFAFWVVIPYGYACQVIMEWAGDSDSDSP